MPPTNRPPEPVLTWQDARGYKLSDRIWSISEATAAQIDALLEDAVNSGTSALSLAKQMEQFLLPGRHLPRTDKPYGTDASFNAMRLARSEITRSHSIAAQASAQANPFVDRLYYHLSSAHQADAGDPCEEFADTSLVNNGYPVDECPLPMVDTHPHCICYVTPGVIPMADAVARIRDEAGFTDDVGVFTDDRQRSLFEDVLWGVAGVVIWEQLFRGE